MKKEWKPYLEVALIFLIYVIPMLIGDAILGGGIFNIKMMPSIQGEIKLYASIYIFQMLVNIVIGILIIFLFKKRSNLISELKLDKRYELNKLKFIIISSIGILLVGILIAKIKIYMDIYTMPLGRLSMGEVLSFPCKIAALIISIVVQEILFRGMIFNRLRENLNIKAAIIIQAVLYGLLFISSGQILFMIVLGAMYGIIYVYSDSIWGAITARMVIMIISLVQSKVLMYSFEAFGAVSLEANIYLLILVVCFIWAIKIYRKKNIGKIVFKTNEKN